MAKKSKTVKNTKEQMSKVSSLRIPISDKESVVGILNLLGKLLK